MTLKHRYSRLDTAFDADHVNFWSNLSRLNSLMVILNISMFFLTGLVAKGYFYTFYSLVCLSVLGVGAIIPTVLVRRLWYYWAFMGIELLGLYYLVASVVYWVRNGSG